jgi:hypothetical protein
MRAYLTQWIASPVWTMNPGMDDQCRAELDRLRVEVRAIETPRAITQWIMRAVAFGIDPL